ncbi:hypothetical protein PTKIN_Ptkin06aG0029700 [Pterospermum kingtungense]
MDPKNHFFLRSYYVKEGHEELVKLSLSPSSSSSSIVHQNPQLPCSTNLQSIDNHHNLDSLPSNNLPTNSRKRSSHSFEGDKEEDHDEVVQLNSISSRPPWRSSSSSKRSSFPHSPSPNPSSSSSSNPTNQVVQVGTCSTNHQPRIRRNPSQKPKRGKSETIAAPYPWATTRRAIVYDLNHLRSQGITMISGDVECKGCEQAYRVEYNLEEKFKEIRDYVLANMLAMHDRAPTAWMNPTLESCKTCGNSLRPVIEKKREINWLFLLLGQSLGCCKHSELRYFCKHTKNHKTGAKDRVLYLTYIGLCKQLDPAGPFDV